jgi:hypothetical protein
VGGLEGIGKRVGSWGKKKKKRKNKKKNKKKEQELGEHQRIAIRRSIRKGGSTQTANFTKPNIILILADDVGVY